MIYVDESVTFDGYKKSPRLRSITGADAMISSSPLPPASENLIKKHVELGAIFFRVITPKDLSDLDVGQLIHNINGLTQLGCKPWQMNLLLDEHDGMVIPVKDYIEKVVAWTVHGGIVYSTYGNPFHLFLDHFEKTWNDQHKNNVSKVYPVWSPKKVEVIRDYRATLATLPGVGYRGADVVRKVIQDNNLGDDLLTALIYLTGEKEMNNADEPMKTIMKQVRDWLGIPVGWDLDIKVSGYNSREV